MSASVVLMNFWELSEFQFEINWLSQNSQPLPQSVLDKISLEYDLCVNYN